ncbi:MAG: hypothetical protein R3F56_07915 [Planctomycetota bacterium]
MSTYADLLGPLSDRLRGVLAPAPFACLVVSGPDAVGFVHRLCTQDIEGLAAGRAAPGAFLTPKGKLETLAWLAREPDRVWIEVQAHELDKLTTLLDRYHFSERLSLEPMRAWSCQMLVGADVWSHEGVGQPAAAVEAEPLWFAGATRGLQWVRFHGEALAVPAGPWRRVELQEWELLRIAAGLPWMGVDADATTLALEADIDDHVATDKGCYTGQEIVARIHTYGHTNRRLCRLRVHATGTGEAPAAIVDGDGDEVGRVTSIARVPEGADALALGYLPHELANAGASLRLASGASVEVV